MIGQCSDNTEPYLFIQPANSAAAHRVRQPSCAGLADGAASASVLRSTDNADPAEPRPRKSRALAADHDPISGGARVTLTPTVTDAEDALDTLTYEWAANGGVFADSIGSECDVDCPCSPGRLQGRTRPLLRSLTLVDSVTLGFIQLIVLAAPSGHTELSPTTPATRRTGRSGRRRSALSRYWRPMATLRRPMPPWAHFPAGISFEPHVTRDLAGRPRRSGSGTLRIRATNTAGTADWTNAAYTTTAVVVPPTPGVLGLRFGGVTAGPPAVRRHELRKRPLRRRVVWRWHGDAARHDESMGTSGGPRRRQSGNIIDVTLDDPIAGGNATQHYVYEHTPSYGTLNQAHPAGHVHRSLALLE